MDKEADDIHVKCMLTGKYAIYTIIGASAVNLAHAIVQRAYAQEVYKQRFTFDTEHGQLTGTVNMPST